VPPRRQPQLARTSWLGVERGGFVRGFVRIGLSFFIYGPLKVD